MKGTLFLASILILQPIKALCECAAQLLPKLGKQEYTMRVAAAVKNDDLSNLILGPAPPQPPPGGVDPKFALWNEIHDQVIASITQYYTADFEPRDIVCLSLSDGDVSVADKLLTYGGKKLLLTGMRRAAPARRRAGLFGEDNELLKRLQKTVLKHIDERLNISFKSCYPLPGASGAGAWFPLCTSGRKYLSKIKNAIANANFPRADEENYERFSVVDDSGTNLDLASVSAFYEQVGALSYIDSDFGILRPISVSVGNGDVSINAALFNPVPPQELVYAPSFIDFVAQKFSVEVTSYYASLFDKLASEPTWSAMVLPSTRLRTLGSVLPVSKQTGIEVGIASLLCREKVNNQPRFADLIEPTRAHFLSDHLSFFCNSYGEGEHRFLDVTEILKTSDTFSSALLGAITEQVGVKISGKLAELAQIQVNQSQLLNDIKSHVGSMDYRQQINQLQATIDAARQRARSHGVMAVLGNVISGVSGVAGFTNIVTGATQLTSWIVQIPTDSSAPLFVANHQSDFNEARENLATGAASIEKVLAAIHNIPRDASNDDIAAFEQQLQQLKSKFAEFQKDVATTNNRLKQQYVTKMLELSELSEERRNIYVVVYRELDKAVIKSILGAHLAGTAGGGERKCADDARAFLERLTPIISALFGPCGAYSQNIQDMHSCLAAAPSKNKTLLVFGAKNGLVVGRNVQGRQCLDSTHHWQPAAATRK